MTQTLLIVSLPFEPIVFGVKLNMHLILEYLAFFVGFRYYVFLRKKSATKPLEVDNLRVDCISKTYSRKLARKNPRGS